MKKVIIGIILGIVICFSFTQVMAEEKTYIYPLQEVGYTLKAIPENVELFIENEKAKTIKFQQESWADGKAQIANTFNKLKLLFVKNQ
jgi:hypothetical protein